MAPPLAEGEAPLAVFDVPAYAPPSVNLLPPEIGQRRALRKLQYGLAAGVVACAAVVGVLYMGASSGKSDAQSRLDAANAQKVLLQGQTAKLSFVSAEKAQIDAARASLKAAMGSEVLWSKTLDDLRLRLPDGVRYATFTVTAITPVATTAGTTTTTTPAPAATSATATALPSNAIATVNLTGSALNLDAVAEELDQLALVPGFSNVYLTTTAQPTPGAIATFTVTADITNAVLSHRYDNITGGSN
jgi:Tfp pilus assembly protein PilN